MRRISMSIAAVLAFMSLLTVGVAPSNAEAPNTDITQSVTDTTGTIDIERVEDLVAKVSNETEFELFVHVTDTFDGMSGAQWTDLAWNGSDLPRDQAVLYAVAIEDKKFGSTFPANSTIAESISAIERAPIDSFKAGKWEDGLEAYANTLIEKADGVEAIPAQNAEKVNEATIGFLTVLSWTVSILVGAVVLFFGFIFGRRGILSFLATNREKNGLSARIADLKTTLPERITKLDQSIVDAKSRIDFAATMYGEEIVEMARVSIKASSASLQKAITALAKVPAEGKSVADKEETLASLRSVERFLAEGGDSVQKAEKTTTDAEKSAKEFKASQEKLTKSTDNTATRVASAMARLEELESQFDADFIAEASKAFRTATQCVTSVKTALTNADEAYKKNELSDAKDFLADGKELSLIASSALDAFTEADKHIASFDERRRDILEGYKMEVKLSSKENAHDSVKPLIAKVLDAVSKAYAVDSHSGNPKQAVEALVQPVMREYRTTVKELLAQKDTVSGIKRGVVRKVESAKGSLSDLREKVRHYGVTLPASAKADFAKALTVVEGATAEVSTKTNTIDTYDVKGAEKFEAKLIKELDRIPSLVQVPSDMVGAIVEAERQAEERRRQAEQKRQAEERRRQAEEEAKRRKKRQEEEEETRRRRRRNSSNSSSYGGYSSGYSSSSSSYDYSSGSSSSSGGSFSSDSGSSGGSW